MDNYKYNKDDVQKNLNSYRCIICGKISLKYCDPLFGACDNCMQTLVINPLQGRHLYIDFKKWKKDNNITNLSQIQVDTNNNNNNTGVMNEMSKKYNGKKLIAYENSCKNASKDSLTNDDILNVKIALNTTDDVINFIKNV